MKQRTYYVYVVTNRTRQLYIGVTSELEIRIEKHKKKEHRDGFTAHWHDCRLVYYEGFEHIEFAIGREKQLKGWVREKKIWLIEAVNPDWHDLSEAWGTPHMPFKIADKKAKPEIHGIGPLYEKRIKQLEKKRTKARSS